jgi:methylthioribose-1-phosphate isomerase
VDLSNAIRLLKVMANAAALGGNDSLTQFEIKSISQEEPSASKIREAYILAAEKILEDDLTTNLAIGRYGAEYLRRQQMPISSAIDGNDFHYFTTSPPGTQGQPDRTYRKLSVLTHCNTG